MGSPPRSKTALARLAAAPGSRACGKLAMMRETGHWLCSFRPCRLFQGGRCYSHFCCCVEKAAVGPAKPARALGPQSARPDLLDRSRPPVSKTGVLGEDFGSLQTSFFRSVADSLRKYQNLRKSASLPTFFVMRVYKSIKIESFREEF